MNEKLRNLEPYPTVRLDKRKAELRAKGQRLFDFGTGDPGDHTPEFIRQALIDAVPEVSNYSNAHGTEDLRRAGAEYVQRRFGVSIDPDTEVLATSGSMEAVFHMPMIVVDQSSTRDVVVYGEPGYRVFEIAAHFAEAKAHAVSLTAENQYLLTPDAVGAEVLSRTALVFLNYPHNPTGQVLPAEVFEQWVAARDAHGFVIVSDECYCDIYYEDPPRSLLEFGMDGCLALHSLSKRSGMTGYQSGFLAGDPGLIATLRRFRTPMGIGSPLWTQAAAAAAWRDVEHVEARRAKFAEKRAVLLAALAARGVEVSFSSAGLFLWAIVPDAFTDIEYADRLLDHGIVVSPGSFYGPGQERFIRLALAPTLEECHAAAGIWPASD